MAVAAPASPGFDERLQSALDAIQEAESLPGVDNELMAANAVMSHDGDMLNMLVGFLVATMAFLFQHEIDTSRHQLGVVLLFLFAFQASGRIECFLSSLTTRASFGRPAMARFIQFPTKHTSAFIGYVATNVLRNNIMPADGGFRLLDIVPVGVFLLLLYCEMLFGQYRSNGSLAQQTSQQVLAVVATTS
jgi:hypothetical protein